MKIEKKTWPIEFDSILKGDKNFDLRLDDFSCAVGDILVLKEWDPKNEIYTGREIEKEVTYVLKTKSLPYWKEEDIENKGFQIFSLK